MNFDSNEIKPYFDFDPNTNTLKRKRPTIQVSKKRHTSPSTKKTKQSHYTERYAAAIKNAKTRKTNARKTLKTKMSIQRASLEKKNNKFLKTIGEEAEQQRLIDEEKRIKEEKEIERAKKMAEMEALIESQFDENALKSAVENVNKPNPAPFLGTNIQNGVKLQMKRSPTQHYPTFNVRRTNSKKPPLNHQTAYNTYLRTKK
jgi:hypothetical protein